MSGMRPTGQLHLGHWLGVLVNWERLQHDYDCFFMVADWHALTTQAERDDLRANTREVLLDWLAAGIDPEQSTMYVQSAIPEIAELNLLFSMITPVNWCQRNPTVKEQASELQIGEDTISMGLLAYPMLQSADILTFKGSLVPVGKDQLPHIEITRDIARRFNHMFGVELFPESQGLLTEAAALPGTDGRKMSKSYGNDIKLADPAEVVQQKVMTMVTDPGRQRRNDPGYPEICTVYAYYQVLAQHLAPQVAEECRSATIGCVQDKRRLAEVLDGVLAPIRERRAHFASQPALLDEIIAEGNRKARAVARETLAEVREAMHLNVHSPALAENPR